MSSAVNAKASSNGTIPAKPEEGKSSIPQEQSGPRIPQSYELVGSPLEAASLYQSPQYLPSYDFPYNPDPLVGNNTYTVYDEMRDDDQIKAVVSIKKDMVVNTGWKISSENPEVVKFVTDALNRINSGLGTDGGFDDVLRDMLSAYEYGFSLTEPVYEILDGMWVYKTIKTRPPHSFLFDIDPRGNVTQIRQLTSTGELKLKPDIFIHHVYQMEFGNPYGKSDFRAAHEPWKAKKFVTKFFNIYLERYATPTLVGKYKPTYTSTDIRRFFDTLKSLQNNSTAVFPEEVLVDFVQPSRDSTDAYCRAIDKYNMQIARAVLVPDLLGLGGGATEGGAYALGKEHFKVFMGTIKKDRVSLERKITQRLVAPLVNVNFGQEWAESVKFEFIPFSDDNVAEYARVWADLVKSKLFEPSDDEINHFRAIVGFPQGEVVRPVKMEPPLLPDGSINPNAGQPVEPAGGPGRPGPGPEEEEDEEDDEEEESVEGQAKPQNVPRQTFAFHAPRKLTTYESKLDLGRIQNDLRDADESILAPLTRTARAIYSGVIEEARNRGLLRRLDVEAVNSIQPKNLRDMNTVFKNKFTELFHEAFDEAAREVYGKEYAAKKPNPLLPVKVEEVIKGESFKMVGDYSMEVTKRMKNIIVSGIKDSAGEGAIVALLRDEAKSFTENWLATVVRTKTTEVYNTARRSFWETDENAKKLIVAYQFSAILDDRTSDICSDLDGKIFEVDDEINRIQPPLHFNCRSLLVPVTKFEEYEPDAVPSIEDVQDLGGGLKKFEDLVATQPLTLTGNAGNSGDHTLVLAPGDGKRLRIRSIRVQNTNTMGAVNIGFRDNLGSELEWKASVPKGGGLFEKVFDIPWALSMNAPLFLNLSSDSEIVWTVEYWA